MSTTPSPTLPPNPKKLNAALDQQYANNSNSQKQNYPAKYGTGSRDEAILITSPAVYIHLSTGVKRCWKIARRDSISGNKTSPLAAATGLRVRCNLQPVHARRFASFKANTQNTGLSLNKRIQRERHRKCLLSIRELHRNISASRPAVRNR